MPNRIAHHKRIITALILLLLLLGSSSVVSAQTAQKGDLSARQIAQRTFPSVVVLVTEDRSGDKYLGSGFFVDRDVVATNYHVIKGATKIVARLVGIRSVGRKRSATSDDEKYVTYQVSVLSTDEEDDLALLKVHGAVARPLTLARGSRVAVGDVVYVAGNPEGLEGTFSQGIVSALRGKDYVQITAAISHGSSGGPVLNSRGDVIGVAVGAIETGQNLNFAVPVSQLSLLITQSKRESIFDQAIREKEARAQQASPDTDSQPSLEETISWLKDKLEGSTNSVEDLHVQIDRLSVSVSQLEKPPALPLCQMDLSLKYNLEGDPYAPVDVYSVFLILAERAEAGQAEGHFGVWLFFRRSFAYEERRGADRQEKKSDFIRLLVRDEDLAERVSKAFDHVIKLCGGGPRKEPF